MGAPKGLGDPDILRRLAETLTGVKGQPALDRFCHQLVVGAARDQGLGLPADPNTDMAVVHELAFVRLPPLVVYARIAIETRGAFRWSLWDDESRGGPRDMSHAQNWRQFKISGLALVGIADGDAAFYYLPDVNVRAAPTLARSILVALNDDILKKWAAAWDALVFDSQSKNSR